MLAINYGIDGYLLVQNSKRIQELWLVVQGLETVLEYLKGISGT